MVNSERKAATWIPVIAGGAAGGVEAAVTYPFECAKTRVQLAQGAKVYSNPFAVVREILKHEGYVALYKGCSTLVLGSIGKDAIRFASFEMIKNEFATGPNRTLTPATNMLAGVASGVIASTLIVTPTERIKTALIDDSRSLGRFRSPAHATITLFRESGFFGLYRGYSTTTLKQVGATAFRLGTFNILKDYYGNHGIEQTPTLVFATGAMAGLITTLATQPFDVLKTRSQSVKGTSTTEAFKTLVASDGIRGFWRGTTMRLGRTVFSGAILFTVYEHLVPLLELATAKVQRDQIS